jgi:holo-[acyl-carrier protein] synthase
LIRVGTDICSLKRIAAAYERFGDRFLNRILTESEKTYVLSSRAHTTARIAGRFAAKEAASKALGTGWYGIGWKEIEISRLPSGEPRLYLHGRAATRAQKMGLKSWELSISHEREYAVATVIAFD